MDSKIILIIFNIEDGDSRNRKYRSVIGEASKMSKALENHGYTWLWDEVKPLLEKGEDGKHYFKHGIAFIYQEVKIPIHTHQYPLVIIKDDNVIDVDEWWYTPFKSLINDAYKVKFTRDLKNYNNNCSREDNLCVLDSGYLCQCTNMNNSDDILVAIKTNNITFNH